MIKLVLFDIDETLLSHQLQRIPQDTIEAIEALHRNHCLVAIATGRGPKGISTEILETIKPDYLIAGNGQLVMNNKEEILNIHYLTNDQIERVTQFGVKHHCVLFWKFLSASYVYSGYKVVKQWTLAGSWGLQDCPQHDRHLYEKCLGGAIDQTESKRYSLPELFPDLDFFTYSSNGADINMKGINKGTGLSELLKDLKITPEECMAFGDSMNDIAMIKKAGIGIAMGNAIPELKQQADYVTTSILDQGISNALKHFNLI